MLTVELESAHGREQHQVALVRNAGGARLFFDGASHDVRLKMSIDDGLELLINGNRHVAYVVQHGELAYVHACGRAWTINLHDPVRDSGKQDQAGDYCIAPMPGTVAGIKVAVGDPVSDGQTLIVIESMKMQMNLNAERDGVVAEVCCALGETFERDAVLVKLAAKES